MFKAKQTIYYEIFLYQYRKGHILYVECWPKFVFSMKFIFKFYTKIILRFRKHKEAI